MNNRLLLPSIVLKVTARRRIQPGVGRAVCGADTAAGAAASAGQTPGDCRRPEGSSASGGFGDFKQEK
jgi:hypothetical protein